jgi:hypothetical protein
LFFRNYPEIKPGAKIYVPAKPQKDKDRMSLGEGIALTSSMVTVAALIISVLRR